MSKIQKSGDRIQKDMRDALEEVLNPSSGIPWPSPNATTHDTPTLNSPPHSAEERLIEGAAGPSKSSQITAVLWHAAAVAT
jgi:hypothetical protein